MRYNLLTDIGNTLTKFAIEKDNRIVWVKRVESSRTADEIWKIISSMGKAHILIVSDVRKNIKILPCPAEECCEKYILLNSCTPLPITLDYETLETLGADRIAAAVGVHSLFPDANCLVIDFGSAITIDYVDKKGRFSGGNISPGMVMRFKALNSFTGSLPLVSPSEIKSITGKNTKEAINNGVVLGIIFEIEQYINKYPDCKIIFTGSDALFFAKKLKFTIFVVCNLVMIGLSKVADFND